MKSWKTMGWFCIANGPGSGRSFDQDVFPREFGGLNANRAGELAANRAGGLLGSSFGGCFGKTPPPPPRATARGIFPEFFKNFGKIPGFFVLFAAGRRII